MMPARLKELQSPSWTIESNGHFRHVHFRHVNDFLGKHFLVDHMVLSRTYQGTRFVSVPKILMMEVVVYDLLGDRGLAGPIHFLTLSQS